MKGKSRIGFQSIVILLLVLVIVLLAILLLHSLGSKPVPPAQSVTEAQRSSGERIGYATTGVTIGTDKSELDQAVEKMMEEANDGIGVEYRVAAYSEDGINFSCYIGNPADSPRDKFIAIYGDAALTDELFVSGLIRPGEAFEEIALNRRLEEESQRLFVAFTDVVDDEDGNQAIYGQTVMVITFNVI